MNQPFADRLRPDAWMVSTLERLAIRLSTVLAACNYCQGRLNQRGDHTLRRDWHDWSLEEPNCPNQPVFLLTGYPGLEPLSSFHPYCFECLEMGITDGGMWLRLPCGLTDTEYEAEWERHTNRKPVPEWGIEQFLVSVDATITALRHLGLAPDVTQRATRVPQHRNVDNTTL